MLRLAMYGYTTGRSSIGISISISMHNILWHPNGIDSTVVEFSYVNCAPPTVLITNSPLPMPTWTLEEVCSGIQQLAAHVKFGGNDQILPRRGKTSDQHSPNGGNAHLPAHCVLLPALWRSTVGRRAHNG